MIWMTTWWWYWWSYENNDDALQNVFTSRGIKYFTMRGCKSAPLSPSCCHSHHDHIVLLNPNMFVLCLPQFLFRLSHPSINISNTISTFIAMIMYIDCDHCNKYNISNDHEQCIILHDHGDIKVIIWWLWIEHNNTRKKYVIIPWTWFTSYKLIRNPFKHHEVTSGLSRNMISTRILPYCSKCFWNINHITD